MSKFVHLIKLTYKNYLLKIYDVCIGIKLYNKLYLGNIHGNIKHKEVPLFY